MISVISLLAQAVRQQARYRPSPVGPAPVPETDISDRSYVSLMYMIINKLVDLALSLEEQKELTKHEPIAVSADVWKHKQFRGLNKASLKKFRKYHEDRPEIFDSFYTLASKTRNAGNSRYSAKCLMEVIRWEQDLQTPGGFKIDNNYTSLYARLLMAYDPSFEGFFELRNAYGPSSKKK